MDNKRVAVMDLGTNTFHLLIAEGPADNFTTVFKTTEAVKLGEGGINNGTIRPEAFARGLAAMQHFQDKILDHNVTAVKAVGTSAVRSAANGQDFIDQVAEKTGIQIELISGEQEAAYIYKGIDASGCLDDENALIMDIGGGSVEFIIANTDEVLWKRSFEIGAARLMDKFHQTDPIPLASIKELTRYLDGKLMELFAAALKYKPKTLIGSSGAFESFAEVIELKKGRQFNLDQTKVYEFDTDDLLDLIELLIKSSHSLRASMKGIIPVRVDMIVVASLLTIYMMQKLGLTDVTLSTYSLKEGVLAGMLG
ncbi:exopolyphosphatase [Mucilaginibacter sp. AK015]|uniref:Ppx/GppA phosphatase family protein n=1 Tax=Mucilaginibacter sp. AK015 TaxID=2723072 RepID=UPI00162265C8|nr:exopolyphosphatase [Mucilaginibacter sp. AK015]MBB5397953.1 exopolyphosphatase/guanosine-5'-triphosphate,3'-diphosphate pyrophosphatase [Mucilaginibacter sp. AK015]